jgi:protein SCO1
MLRLRALRGLADVSVPGIGIRALVAAFLLAIMVPAGCGSQVEKPRSATLSGIVRDPTPVVDTATLPDVSNGGTASRFRADPGGLLLVYFGYTLCPDVCPTTMSDLRIALGGLPAAQRKTVRPAMITVDPRRDTPAVLTHYVHAFFPRGLALRTADPRLLARVAKTFGAAYRVTKEKDGSVDVMHTAFVYAVDDTGHLRVQWSFGTRPATYRKDIRLLLEESRP